MSKVQREPGRLLTPGSAQHWQKGSSGPWALTLCHSYPTLQLDADDAKPTFDEEGQDEYDEVPMPM